MSTSSRDVFNACVTGDVARVRQSVADGIDMRKVVNKGWFNYTPLHYACKNGHLLLAKYLIEDLKCSPTCADTSKWTPMHHACRSGHLPLVKYLFEDLKCSPTCTSINGWTPLHHACRHSHTAVASFLLQKAQCDPNCVTNDGSTPLDVSDNPELIRLLLSSGAKPTASCFPSHLQDNPTDMAINVFVLGNPGAGKSTFIKALSTEGHLLSRIKHQFTKVRDVDEKTAGIIPHDIYSKALGRLTLYDFAGHKEYYAGHDALLHNAMTNSPSIVTLVVDMRDEEGKISETLLYWLQFINNHSSGGEAKPHLLIIGSHANVIPSSEVRQKSRALESVVNSCKFDSATFAGLIVIDCRYAESSSMSKLRSILSQICQSLRSTEEMAAAHHCFLVFLLHRFKDRLAITYSDAADELRHRLNDCQHLITHEYRYLGFIKSSDPHEMCIKLNERGSILFMKNNECPERSWIVLDKAVLLSQINGVIFAPVGFKEHQKSLSTGTGVVPLSKLAPLFPNINSDMIIQFLCHLEFCQEIKDLNLASLLVAEGQSAPISGERYFFFPGLVHLDTPQDVIESGASKLDYNSGWVLQCSEPEQFFSSRFLQILLLRLAFLFALAPTDLSTGDRLALHRKCSVWKNGIYWVNRSGGEAIVEVNHLRQVMVVIRSKLKKMELVRLRSAVIKTVVNAKEEFCSKIFVRESLILPEDAALYPLDSSKMTGVSITEVAATIVEGKEFAINEINQTIELKKLTYFEPYAYLGEPLLQELLSKDSTEDKEITDDLLTDIASKSLPENLNEYCAIFEQEIGAYASHEGAHGLFQVFQLWRDRMGKEGTCKNFKKRLDQFSIFAGRNPLRLIVTGPALLSDLSSAASINCAGRTPPMIAESATNLSDCEDQRISQYRESDSAISINTASAQCDKTEGKDHDRNTFIPYNGDWPKLQLHELQLLEGVDGGKVRVLESVAPNWKDLAIALGFDQSRIKTIEKDYRGSVEEACQEMFMRWLDGEHDLAQPCTWDTLIKCLRRAVFRDLAIKLRAILNQ